MGESIRISFTGDLLVYRDLIRKSRVGKQYDFSPVFDKVKHLFKESDYVVGNLETPLAGPEAGYTMMDMLFNTPDEFAYNAKKAGFDMFTTANNHCMDKGEEGLKRTLDILDYYGIEHTGTFRNVEEKRYLIKEIGGLKIGFLSYTYGTNPNVNGYKVNNENDYLVNITKQQDEPYKRPMLKQFLLSFIYRLPLKIQNTIHPLYPNHAYEDNVNKEAIYNAVNVVYVEELKRQISRVKSEADIVVVCLHAGGQFNSKVGEYTQYLINEIESQSADLLIINHPHCVLSSKWNSNSFHSYSLGNFCFTPGEGYFIDGVCGEYGVVLHVDLDRVSKCLKDIFFNVIKNVKINVGREEVVTVYELYNKSTNAAEKDKLAKDLCTVINRFLNSNLTDVKVAEIYNYKDFMN